MTELLDDLRSAINSIDEMEDEADFIPIAEDIISQIKQLSNSIDSIPPILKIIEENDDKDYGSPGPIGHYFETFYGKGYEELLIESLSYKPRPYTIFLLHRIISDEENEKRTEYLRLLRQISTDSAISQAARDEAIESLEYFG